MKIIIIIKDVVKDKINISSAEIGDKHKALNEVTSKAYSG